MSNTRFEVIVFDFDGTLVQSAAAKRQAFFDAFPPDCAPAVAAVLERDPDGSRHRVIPEMIAEAARRGIGIEGLEAASLIVAYGGLAAAAVERAPEMPGASALLRQASALASLYVASITPHNDIQSLVARRGWLDHLSGVYGHPHQKVEIVAMLLERHGIGASRLLVVGDGASDREAAARNGCPFHEVTGPGSLMEVPGFAGLQRV